LRDSWLPWVVVAGVGVIGGVIAFRAANLYLDTAIERNDWSQIHDEIKDPRAVYQRYVIVWTFLLIGWLSSLMLVVGPALGSSELTHPVNAVAFGADAQIPCYRCSMVAWASFPVDGRVVTTDLRGLSQAATFYRPGIAIVYDSDAPTIAMARADYEAGKTDLVWVVVPLSTGLFGLGTWFLVRLNGLRRASRS